MRNFRLASLELINHCELTEIWNRCWQGYYYNMSYTHEHMRLWLDLSRVSLEYSIGIYVDNQIVGFSLLSVDAEDGWIAAACIDPDYRRKGFFKVLMRTQLDLASRLNLKRVYLEVLEQNHALKVYQSVGFASVRQLNLYLARNRTDNFIIDMRVIPIKSVPVDLYFENRSQACINPAWQRREDYLRRHANFFAIMNLTGTAGALFSGEKKGFLIDVWSATAVGADEIISALLQRSSQPFTLINQPKDWIFAFLSANKILPSAIQLEMCIHLT